VTVRDRGALPPWTWFYIALYLWEIDERYDRWRLLFDDVFLRDDPDAAALGTHFYSLFRLLSLAELIPSLALGVGVALVFLPWLRAAYVRRAYSLQPAGTQPPALAEIRTFLDASGAQHVELHANLVRSDQLAFVYPLGYRRSAVAVFGGMVRLWRSDRAAAEAVLIHELAHVRAGDHLVVGVGSLFAALARWWIPIYIVFALVPTLIVAVDTRVSELASPEFVTSQALTMSFQVLVLLLLPVTALWLSELEADRSAAETAGSPAPMRGALQRDVTHGAWWRTALLRLSHPPAKLRLWLIRRWRSTLVATLALLAYTALSLSRLPLLLAHAAEVYRTLEFTSAEARTLLEANARDFLDTATEPLIAMAALVALWPVVAPQWSRLWVVAQSSPPHVRPANMVAAAIIALIAGVSAMIAAG
jgi:Zn-dependent protease with chaperone function